MTRAAKSIPGKYRKPRIGEKRQSRQPLRIDKLPLEVKTAIISARNAGQTWKEAAESASVHAGTRLSPTTVQRWYDLRVEQPHSNASAIALLLREIVDLLKSRLPAVNA